MVAASLGPVPSGELKYRESASPGFRLPASCPRSSEWCRTDRDAQLVQIAPFTRRSKPTKKRRAWPTRIGETTERAKAKSEAVISAWSAL
jgi:hypothetical protein